MTPEEEEELKRRQLAELRAKQGSTANDQKVAQGCTTGCVGVIVIIGIIVWAVNSCGGSSTNTASDNSGGATIADSTPNPHATSYEQGRQAEKSDFLAGVDESISGAMIAGNKLKYVGESVDLHCTVFAVIDSSTFNAECGEDSDGLPVIIAVQYDDTSSLSKGQTVRILGTVQEPMEGVNGFGGAATFPTVKAEFME